MPEHATLALGLEHHQAGRLAEAEAVYRGVLARDPDNADALNLLGVVSCQLGRRVDAAGYAARAVGLRPNAPVFHNNLGLILQVLGRQVEAIRCFEKALELDPDYPEACNNLGNALQNEREIDRAIACYRQALRLKPHYAQAHNNLGNTLHIAGRLAEAEACYREAARLNPAYAEAWNNLGAVLQAQARIPEAVPCYRRALELQPDYHRAHSNLLFCLHYDPAQTPDSIFQEHCRWARQHAAGLAGSMPPVIRAAGRPLRIGYMSPDFREHSVAFFFEPVLRAHNRRRFEIYCYADFLRPDKVTERLMRLADHWRHIYGRTDADVAQLVRDDRIDVLVDLAGHTAGDRLLVFARKPAPIQATWIGYPDTTGLATVDYRITDAWADPAGQTERFHTEELVRLPNGFLCYQPPPDSPRVSEPPALKTGQVTFGSFNNLGKVNPQALAVWSKILARTPGSRLLLKARALEDPETCARTWRALAESGIPAERAQLCGPVDTVRSHLASYERIDVALDTFPYNGTTTTCEALWMGVPVVVLAGQAHVSRVGVSLLANLGLPQLIADSPARYVEIAVELAGDLDRLRRLRRELRATMTRAPLTDAAGFTRTLEDACTRMWDRWCAGRPGLHLPSGTAD